MGKKGKDSGSKHKSTLELKQHDPENLEKKINKLKHILMGKFKVSGDIALEAVHQAYLEIQGKELDNYMGYWYVASKHRLFDYFNKEKRTTILKEYNEPSSFQDDAFYKEEIIEELKEELSEADLELFEALAIGRPVASIAQDKNISVETAYELRDNLIELCRDIVAGKTQYTVTEEVHKEAEFDEYEVDPEEIKTDRYALNKDEEFKHIVGQYLSIMRKRRKVLSEDLSAILGKDPSAVAVMKHYGMSSFELFIQYCNALKINPVKAFEECIKLFEHFKNNRNE